MTQVKESAPEAIKAEDNVETTAVENTVENTEQVTDAGETSVEPILDLGQDLRLDIGQVESLLTENKGLSKFVEDDKFNVNKALKSLTNAEKLIGKRIEEAEPEVLGKLLTKFGVPESAEQYEIEGEQAEQFKTIAKEAGVPKAAAEKMFEKLKEVNAPETIVEKEKALIEADLKELAETFGDKLETVKKSANKALEHFADDSVKEAIAKAGLGTDAKFIKFLSEIGEKFIDKDLKNETPASYVASSEEVRKDIDKIRNSAEYKAAIQNPYGAEFKQISEHLSTLYKAL